MLLYIPRNSDGILKPKPNPTLKNGCQTQTRHEFQIQKPKNPDEKTDFNTQTQSEPKPKPDSTQHEFWLLKPG